MNLIKSHKIVTATILVGIIGSTVGIAVINQPVDNQVRHVSEMVAEKTPPKETEPITEVSTEASTESSQEILVENTPEPAPVVVERKIATPEDVTLRVYQSEDITGHIAEKIRPLKYSEITILLGAQKAVASNTIYQDELDSLIYQCIDYAEALIKDLESKGRLLHRDNFICQV